VSGRPGLFRVRAHLEDGSSFTVEATARDVLVWERTGGGKTNKVFQDLVRSQSMVDMYRVTHIAATRLGLYKDDLRTFESTVDLENLELDDDDQDEEGDGADPTQPAR
jgi:hypothetical protein